MPGRRPAPRALWRRFGLGSGPLKRTSDRVEVASRLALVLLLLLAVPAAELAGAARYSAVQSTVREQAGSRSAVTATLLADAPGTHSPGIGSTVPSGVRATAAWEGPDGVSHTGTVTAAPGSRAGTPVTVWVDRAGRPTPAPIDEGEAVAQGTVTGVAVLAGVALAGVCGHAAVLWLLARRRLRRWGDDWAAVEPLWASRFR